MGRPKPKGGKGNFLRRTMGSKHQRQAVHPQYAAAVTFGQPLSRGYLVRDGPPLTIAHHQAAIGTPLTNCLRRGIGDIL